MASDEGAAFPGSRIVRFVHYRLVVIAIAVLGIALLAYPLARSFALVDINYNEGWNGYFQLRAAHGAKLYSGYSPYVFNNYPPLSFYLVGGLGELFGDPVIAGRLVSIAALCICAAAIFQAVRTATGEWLEALAASAIVMVAFTTTYIEYTGMNDPQLLGMAFAICAFTMHLNGHRSIPRTMAIAGLIGTSLLIKHNLLAIPAVISIDVLIRGTNRQRLAYFATGLAIGLAGALWLHFSEGPAAFHQILASRGWSAIRAATMSAELFIRHQGLLLVGTVGAFLIADRTARLVLGYIAVSLVIGTYFTGGAGTAANMFYDLIFALALGSGLVLARARAADTPPIVLAAIMIACCFAPLVKAPLVLGITATKLTGGLAADERAFAEDVAFVRQAQGEVLCESHMLCLRAGRPMDVELFNSIQAMNVGALPPDALAKRLQRREFALVQIKYLILQPDKGDPATLSVGKALQDNYRVVRRGTTGDFWAPR